MEFKELIISQLSPVLEKQGFEIVEASTNVVRFESSIIKINIVFNDYDKSNFIEIGKRGEFLYPLNDKVIRNIFHSELQIDKVTPEVFVRNLALLFEEKEGLAILRGNIGHLVTFIENESADYTNELLQKQTLESATKAWENCDYQAFVSSIDKLGQGKIPRSYQLKYKIAKQKIEGIRNSV